MRTAFPVQMTSCFRVRLIEGNNIYGDDNRPCDPYIKISLDAETQRSAVVRETSNPKWDEEFQFPYNGDRATSLRLELFDSDNFGSDILLGSQKIPAQALESRAGFTFDFWLVLKTAESGGGTSPFNSAFSTSFDSLVQKSGRFFFSSNEIKTVNEPVLHAQIQYMSDDYLKMYQIEVVGAKPLHQTGKAPIVYEIQVRRNDGLNKMISCRYSHILKFREDFIKINPAVNKIEFPPKNYLFWLSWLVPSLSNTRKEFIDKRKQMLQEFFDGIQFLPVLNDSPVFRDFCVENERKR